MKDKDTFDVHLELLRETILAYSKFLSIQEGRPNRYTLGHDSGTPFLPLLKS